MINIRYHIISITAVFLALGLGLAIGSSYLSQVTEDTLKGQIADVEKNIREEQARNDELSSRVGHLEDRDDQLAALLPEQLFTDRLESVPVLLVATRGTDEDLVDEATQSLEAAGAAVAGTWWLTDRWSLDDAEEVQDLATLLGLETIDPARLRRATASRLSQLLEVAGGAAAGPTSPPADEPELVAALEDSGFLDYEARPGSGDNRVLLPGAGARFVMVSGTQPDAGEQQFLLTVLEEVAADGAAPVVAVQGEVDLQDEDGPASEDARRTTFVGPVREGEDTGANLSTVDDLDTAAGLVAMVLAVEDLASGTVGHYGVASGASRLLPGPDPAP